MSNLQHLVNLIDKLTTHDLNTVNDLVLVCCLTKEQREEFRTLHGDLDLVHLKRSSIVPTFAVESSLNPIAVCEDCYVLTERGFALRELVILALEQNLPVWSLKNNQYSELGDYITELLNIGVIMTLPDLDYPDKAIDKAYKYFDTVLKREGKILNCSCCNGYGKLKESEPSTLNFNEGAIHFRVICNNEECEAAKVKLWDITPWEALTTFIKGDE